jgi:hypothetical protein
MHGGMPRSFLPTVTWQPPPSCIMIRPPLRWVCLARPHSPRNGLAISTMVGTAWRPPAFWLHPLRHAQLKLVQALLLSDYEVRFSDKICTQETARRPQSRWKWIKEETTSLPSLGVAFRDRLKHGAGTASSAENFWVINLILMNATFTTSGTFICFRFRNPLPPCARIRTSAGLNIVVFKTPRTSSILSTTANVPA